ncbi:MAG: hypothetical protein JNK16_10100 [Phycisphaerales bacterium]|nr:hypothetical protein [Phycisphaerales bacterium]
MLGLLRQELLDLDFLVESGKKLGQKVQVPVLFGLNGEFEKSFDCDAFHEESGLVLEIEAGRAVTNNQFLKDLFEACVMHNVHELAIAIRNEYKGQKDFSVVTRFLDTLYASGRLTLPLRGVLVIGY